MSVLSPLARLRNRAVWSDPVRKLRTLESFAETEEDGGKDLEAAARRAGDPDLRTHLQRHASDERRHAELFRHHAEELRARAALPARSARESDLSYDLSRGRRGVDLDAHGFFTAGLFDELGEVAYVAMLHVAEQRAADVFRMHLGLVDDDPALSRTFEEILRDEKYHVAYTARFLERWRSRGREREVREALRRARSSRFLGAWRRLGVRSGAGFSKAVLFVLYWTLLLPFAIAARLSRPRPPSHERDDTPTAEMLRRQA